MLFTLELLSDGLEKTWLERFLATVDSKLLPTSAVSTFMLGLALEAAILGGET